MRTRINHKRNAILLLLISFHYCIYGQYTYYKSALIIKSDSSKLTGYVERKSASDVSFGLRYKKTLEEKSIQKIPVQDIDQIVFTDDSSMFCKVSYIHYKDSVKIEEYRLAMKLLGGYADLYKLQLPNKELNIIFEKNNTFVYIIKIHTTYYVLDQTEKLENSTYKLRKGYIGVLRHIFKGNDKLKCKLVKLKFRDSQIIPLIDALNIEHPEIPKNVLYKKDLPNYYHGLFAGFTLLDNDVQKLGTSFEAGYTASIYHPEISEKISTDIGLSIALHNYHDTLDPMYPKIKIPFATVYHFNNNVFSPFIGVGLSPCLQYIKFIILMRASAGIMVFKKYSLSCTLEGWPVRRTPERSLLFQIGWQYRL
jgi:hypothetical protein